jgi:hypothetical protein
MLIFAEGGNPEKIPQLKQWRESVTNWKIEPRPQWWEESALTAMLPMLSCTD